jgi:hypothetical protein
MNIYQFVTISLIKFLAVELMLVGIFFQIKETRKLGNIIVTCASLVFAIASNVTLFIVMQNFQK